MIRRHRFTLCGLAVWSVLLVLTLAIPPAGPALVAVGVTASAGAALTEVVHHDRT